ncbi:chitin-binding type-4 domain-containing protein [Pycnococcus provasolii]
MASSLRSVVGVVGVVGVVLCLCCGPLGAYGHGAMLTPTPRQPEPLYWYQVGCMTGCKCSGGGKEQYPTAESLGCTNPTEPTLKPADRTWNVVAESPRGDWNKYAPWRAPGTAIPLDSCGIASGFLPTAAVQFPHQFKTSYNVTQGELGSKLPKGNVTEWEAGAVVEASFTLIVNHGGGYQYRVCPAGNAVNENCFAANVLPFADNKHTVRFKSGKPVEINALDVSEGVAPAGSTWRRLPIPACNCDIGEGCQVRSKDADAADGKTGQVSYVAYNQGKGVGHCATGLQFEAEHLSKVWPEGYGYYTARLGRPKYDYGYNKVSTETKPAETGKDDGKDRPCDASTQDACEGIAGCEWYAPKNMCYLPSPAQKCPNMESEDTCIKQNGCAWAANKKVCYSSGSMGKETGSMGKETGKTAPTDFSGTKGAADSEGESFDWWIVDKLKAPTEPGEYILQWRWDNEQTPQIWTTCADIKVVAPASRSAETPPQSTTNAPSSGARLACVSSMALTTAFAIMAALV